MDDCVDDYTFTLYNTLLQRRCGLHFKPATRIDLELGLQQAMQQANIHTLAEYYHLLENTSTDSLLWKQLIAQLTIGETYFFRDSNQFRALRDVILPTLIEEKRRRQFRILRLWSAGCASGEEPYSLAILLHELLDDLERWHITINGTDINERSLEKARIGRYGSWSFRMETPEVIRQQYFQSCDDHTYEIIPQVRRMVNYRYLNLVEPGYPSLGSDTSNMDLILCRNVTIYFDRPTTQEIINRFYESLIEGGWLLVGHSEPLPSIYQAYETHFINNAVCYRKGQPHPVSVSRPAPPLQEAFSPQPKSQYNEPTAPQRDFMGEVDALLRMGRLMEAQNLLETLVAQAPQHVEALYLLAKLAVDKGRIDGVHNLLDQIDHVDPLVPQAHYLRALLHQQAGAWEPAKAALRRALYADRDFALAHYLLGELLYQEGNLAMARKSWRNAASVLAGSSPNSPLAYGDGITNGSLLHALEQRLAVS